MRILKHFWMSGPVFLDKTFPLHFRRKRQLTRNLEIRVLGGYTNINSKKKFLNKYLSTMNFFWKMHTILIAKLNLWFFLTSFLQEGVLSGSGWVMIGIQRDEGISAVTWDISITQSRWSSRDTLKLPFILRKSGSLEREREATVRFPSNFV